MSSPVSVRGAANHMHEPVVERLAGLRVADAAQGGEALLRPRRRQRVDHSPGRGPGDAHHGDAGPPGRRR